MHLSCPQNNQPKHLLVLNQDFLWMFKVVMINTLFWPFLSYMTERIRPALLSQTLLRVVVSRQLRCVHSNSACYITDLSGLQTIHHVATTDGSEAPSSRCLESRSRRRLLRSVFSFLFSFLDELTDSAWHGNLSGVSWAFLELPWCK